MHLNKSILNLNHLHFKARLQQDKNFCTKRCRMEKSLEWKKKTTKWFKALFSISKNDF